MENIKCSNIFVIPVVNEDLNRSAIDACVYLYCVEKGLDLFQNLALPGLESNTLCHVAWCPEVIKTIYRTYLIYYVGLPSHFQISSSVGKKNLFH